MCAALEFGAIASTAYTVPTQRSAAALRASRGRAATAAPLRERERELELERGSRRVPARAQIVVYCKETYT